ncbi:hypothetical protein MKW92_016795 [Papaver armeniacum]|nr:hypothetical protein MKW92_016795 [Papaver armeniacum]
MSGRLQDGEDHPMDGEDHPVDNEVHPMYPYGSDYINPSLFAGVSFYSAETIGYPPQPDPCSNDEVITICQDKEIPPPFEDKYSDVDSADPRVQGFAAFGLRKCNTIPQGKEKSKNEAYHPNDITVCQDKEILPLIEDKYSDDDSVDSADSRVQGFAAFGLRRCKKSKNEEHHGCSDAYHPNAQRETMKKSTNEDHQEWIDSWYKGTEAPPQADNIILNYYVCTDGYHRKGRKGGYGVIIRDDGGKPIVASAVAATEVVSLLYHQLQGVVRGVELAVDYSIRDIALFCNAKSVVRLVKSLETKHKCYIHSAKANSFDVLCKDCVMDLTRKEEYPLVLPLLKRIAEMEPKFYMPITVDKCEREHNKAADYLAKNGAPGMEKLSQCDFPDELKEIICKDYFESATGLPF